MSNNPTAGSSSSSAPPPPWIELPRDVTVNILRRLDPEDILDRAERVCTTWRSACAEPSLWRAFHMKYSDELHTPDYADSVCRRAVNRSWGEMIDINIKHFGTDDLLRYISERLTDLRILTLEPCCGVSPRGLTTAVQNFPHLEELHLFFMGSIRAMDIEAIGVSCPMLKSFTFNNRYLNFPQRVIIDNNYALSIAKNMPNLVRLSLVGNLMGNEGLLAILDCCPNLESLDLRLCFGVDLECDIGRRCVGKIRELRCPLDSTVYEWDDRNYYDPEVESDFSDDDFNCHTGEYWF